MRSTTGHVVFHHPFRLRGMDGVEPAGTYSVITDEEEIPELSFIAWRRVATSLRLPADGRNTGQEQYVLIDPVDLRAALDRDAARLIDPAFPEEA